MSSPYKRPPIIEAVIEVRCEGSVEREVVDRLKRRLSNRYPLADEAQSFDVQLGPMAAIRQQFEAYHLRSTDGTDTVILGAGNIATTRLPPYEGWEGLFAKARENWEEWKTHVASSYALSPNWTGRHTKVSGARHTGTSSIFECSN
jgi:uncharacterized protein (TIGR04255 family)